MVYEDILSPTDVASNAGQQLDLRLTLVATPAAGGTLGPAVVNGDDIQVGARKCDACWSTLKADLMKAGTVDSTPFAPADAAPVDFRLLFYGFDDGSEGHTIAGASGARWETGGFEQVGEFAAVASTPGTIHFDEPSRTLALHGHGPEVPTTTPTTADQLLRSVEVEFEQTNTFIVTNWLLAPSADRDFMIDGNASISYSDPIAVERIPPIAVVDVTTTPADTRVALPVTANDTDADGSVDATTVTLIDPSTRRPDPDGSVTSRGQGTWTVEPDGHVRFDPQPSFAGDAAIAYTVDDDKGNRSNVSMMAVTVTEPAETSVSGHAIAPAHAGGGGEGPTVAPSPMAQPDVRDGVVPGSAVSIDVLANDPPGLEPSSVVLIDPATLAPTRTLVVPGEGAWSVDPVSGVVTFTPDPDSDADPTPVVYAAGTAQGAATLGAITIRYADGTLSPPTLPATGSATSGLLWTGVALLLLGSLSLYGGQRHRSAAAGPERTIFRLRG